MITREQRILHAELAEESRKTRFAYVLLHNGLAYSSSRRPHNWESFARAFVGHYATVMAHEYAAAINTEMIEGA